MKYPDRQPAIRGQFIKCLTLASQLFSHRSSNPSSPSATNLCCLPTFSQRMMGRKSKDINKSRKACLMIMFRVESHCSAASVPIQQPVPSTQILNVIAKGFNPLEAPPLSGSLKRFFQLKKQIE